jgi:hypothetical protein
MPPSTTLSSPSLMPLPPPSPHQCPSKKGGVDSEITLPSTPPFFRSMLPSPLPPSCPRCCPLPHQPQQERGCRQQDHLAVYTPFLLLDATLSSPSHLHLHHHPASQQVVSHFIMWMPLSPLPLPHLRCCPLPYQCPSEKGDVDSKITLLSIPPFSPSPNEWCPILHHGHHLLPLPLPLTFATTFCPTSAPARKGV